MNSPITPNERLPPTVPVQSNLSLANPMVRQQPQTLILILILYRPNFSSRVTEIIPIEGYQLLLFSFLFFSSFSMFMGNVLNFNDQGRSHVGIGVGLRENQKRVYEWNSFSPPPPEPAQDIKSSK